MRQFFIVVWLWLLAPLLTGCAAGGADHRRHLESWNDGPSRQAIERFVKRTTTEGSGAYVPPAQRIAVFDNDGTLWCEQPVYVQLAFVVDRVRALAPQHPQWRQRDPFKSVLEGDLAKALGGGEKAVAELLAATHAGMSTDEFDRIVTDWISTARHPRTGKLYTEMVYQPMLELLAYLRANGFKTYIVSGGGVEFMRPWADRVYGIPPEQVVGSRGKLKFEMREGAPVLMKLPEIDLIDDGPGKPVGIQQVIGERPIAAFGNSDGDMQMLQWATLRGDGLQGFALIFHHTDSVREYAYDRASHIGKLDKALDEAAAHKWTVVDMKTEWSRIFP